MAELRIFVPGKPIAKGSAKWIRSASTGKSIPAKNEPLENWQSRVSHFARMAFTETFGDDVQLWNVAVYLAAEFTFERPQSHHVGNDRARPLKGSAPPYPIGRPDRGKLLRCVEDALEGIVYRDDAQVCEGSVRKAYGKEPGVAMSLWHLKREVIEPDTLERA